MRYPPTHKHVTRRRIVDAAAQAFRERGVTETGVDEVMRRAGLTHGGFYSHFADKTELVAEASAAAFAAAVPNLGRIAVAPSPAARARLLIDSYLSVRHRDNRGTGCFVVAVGADMARVGGHLRSRYAQEFSGHLDRLADAGEIGRLLHQSWMLKRELAGSITTNVIDEIYDAAMAAGALGGKVLGAGGGGFMAFYVPPERRKAVAERLKDLIQVPFKIGSPGSRVIVYEPGGEVED